jgi:hypothetical protein
MVDYKNILSTHVESLRKRTYNLSRQMKTNHYLNSSSENYCHMNMLSIEV